MGDKSHDRLPQSKDDAPRERRHRKVTPTRGDRPVKLSWTPHPHQRPWNPHYGVHNFFFLLS